MQRTLSMMWIIRVLQTSWMILSYKSSTYSFYLIFPQSKGFCHCCFVYQNTSIIITESINIIFTHPWYVWSVSWVMKHGWNILNGIMFLIFICPNHMKGWAIAAELCCNTASDFIQLAAHLPLYIKLLFE